MPQQGDKEEISAARAELDAKQAQIRQQAEIDTKQLEIDYLRTQLEPGSLPTSPQPSMGVLDVDEQVPASLDLGVDSLATAPRPDDAELMRFFRQRTVDLTIRANKIKKKATTKCYEVVETSHGKDVQLDIERCCDDLPVSVRAETKAQLEKLDTDGNGKIVTSEIVAASKQMLRDALLSTHLGFAIVCFLLVFFGLNVTAQSIAQPTQVAPGGALMVRGATLKAAMVVQTAEATHAIPVAVSPVLTAEELKRVKKISVSNLHDAVTKKPCESCAKTIQVQVDLALKYSDTRASFLRTGGTNVTVDRGLIYVSNVPGEGNKTFVACAMATCSSIQINGVDVPALKEKARLLGYVSTGRRVFSIGTLTRGVIRSVRSRRGKVNGKGSGSAASAEKKDNKKKYALMAAGAACVAGGGMLMMGKLTNNAKLKEAGSAAATKAADDSGGAAAAATATKATATKATAGKTGGGIRAALNERFEKIRGVKGEFDTITDTIAKGAGGRVEYNDVKGMERAIEKTNDWHDGDPSKIADLMRSTIEVNSPADANKVLEDLRANKKIKVTDKYFRNLLGKDSAPMAYGYRDLKMVVEMDGVMAEIQVNLPEMLAVKRKMHGDYEVVRALDGKMLKGPLSPAETADRLQRIAKMESAYGAVWEKFQAKKGGRRSRSRAAVDFEFKPGELIPFFEKLLEDALELATATTKKAELEEAAKATHDKAKAAANVSGT